MASTSIVRLRPTGPWRFGPESGARDRVDSICHSDAVYSAVTHAMARLGSLQDWLSATTATEPGVPAVRFGSLYPFQRDTLFVAPPRHLWPPAASGKIRYKAARLVPVAIIQALLSDTAIDEDRWSLDGESECLVPFDRQRPGGPFRVGMRSNIAVDRLSPGALEPHATACLEFAPGAGLWMLVVFADDDARSRWQPPVASALKLLADSGMGGERSRGWGRSADPEWEDADPFFLPAVFRPATGEHDNAYWLLSLYDPAQNDAVDWNEGNYTTMTRSGRIESAERWGELKQPTLMIAEGSVLVSKTPPSGTVRNIAPEGFPHPVFRAGCAVSITIPWRPAL